LQKCKKGKGGGVPQKDFIQNWKKWKARKKEKYLPTQKQNPTGQKHSLFVRTKMASDRLKD